jgi:hypothetical protein
MNIADDFEEQDSTIETLEFFKKWIKLLEAKGQDMTVARSAWKKFYRDRWIEWTPAEINVVSQWLEDAEHDLELSNL